MQDTSYKIQEGQAGTAFRCVRIYLYLVTCILYLFINGCGFHLRGVGATELPAELRTLKLEVPASGAAFDPLREAMRNALQAQGGATVVDSGEVPVLRLEGEAYETRVLSVSSTVKAAEYLVLYHVNFRVTGVRGNDLVPTQTVALQRDYAFDPVNVLAKEREEQELRQSLRQDAVRQILRRLAKSGARPEAASGKPQ
jgi:LPS-assembly lipoprotein